MLCLIFTTLVCPAFAGIVWDSETGWHISGRTPKGTPVEQLEQGKKQLKEKDWKSAYRTFFILYKYYPRSPEAPKALLKAAQALAEWGYHKKALKILDRLVSEYPKSELSKKAVEMQFDIGMRFYQGAKRKIWGIEWFRSYGSGIEAFRKVLAHDPFGELADDAMFYIGRSAFKMGQYDLSIENLEELQDKFPNSIYSGECEYYIAHSLFENNKGAGYSMGILKKAEVRLRKYLDLFPKGRLQKDAKILLTDIRNMQAKFYYNTARFYESWNKFRSAEIYYEIILKHFSDLSWEQKANNRLKIIRPKINS